MGVLSIWYDAVFLLQLGIGQQVLSNSLCIICLVNIYIYYYNYSFPPPLPPARKEGLYGAELLLGHTTQLQHCQFHKQHRATQKQLQSRADKAELTAWNSLLQAESKRHQTLKASKQKEARGVRM